MAINPLIGRTLTGIQLAADRTAIKFLLADGEVVALCDADCCSFTWVENVEEPALGYPATVTSVENVDMAEPKWDDNGGEFIQFYGFRAITDRGELLIDYRNESNGYYGGNLSWPSDRSWFYGGVHGQNVSKEQWQSLQDVGPRSR